MEWLGLVEAVAILSSNLVSVKILLGLPGGTIEEVHGSVETTSSDCGLARLGRLHGVIKVDAALVRDLLAQVITGLESGVREGLSGSGGHLLIPDAGVSHRQRGLTIAVVNSVHGIVILWNACGIETKCIECEEVMLLTQWLRMGSQRHRGGPW